MCCSKRSKTFISENCSPAVWMCCSKRNKTFISETIHRHFGCAAPNEVKRSCLKLYIEHWLSPMLHVFSNKEARVQSVRKHVPTLHTIGRGLKEMSLIGYCNSRARDYQGVWFDAENRLTLDSRTRTCSSMFPFIFDGWERKDEWFYSI